MVFNCTRTKQCVFPGLLPCWVWISTVPHVACQRLWGVPHLLRAGGEDRLHRTAPPAEIAFPTSLGVKV